MGFNKAGVKMSGILDDMIWYCNARSKGVEYANLEERVRKCESESHDQSSVTISFGYVPKVQKHRGQHRGGIRR